MHQPVVIFLMLSISAVLSRPALSSENTRDQFNFSSLSSRNHNRTLATPQDLPDEMLLVSVKDAGNENDPDTDLGMVIEEYSISQTEVTARQYCTYLNEVATGENFERFYNEKMGTDPNVASIKRDVIDGKNVYTVIVDKQGDRGNFPIVYVNLYQAARFCNWLQNRSTPDLTGDDLTERGAYTLDGKNSGPIARNPDAVWFIPTESEWYKSAYYKGGGLRAGYWHFANRSDWAPSNAFEGGVNSANYETSSYTKKGPPYLTDVNHFEKSAGTYNTLDMSGNAAEWVATEETQGVIPLKYVARGGSWKSLYYGTGLESKGDVANWGVELSKWSRPAYDPAQGYDNIGFRVATSLLVDSLPPATEAPGESELTPKEMLQAPFVLVAGIGMIFSGKKMAEYHQKGETAKFIENTKHQALRERTASSSMENDFTPRKKQPITQQQKAEIEKSVDRIPQLFEKAVKLHQEAKKLLLQKGTIQSADLRQLTAASTAYYEYADAVLKTLTKLQENFPHQKELLLPWYETSKKILIEAMILGHAVTKGHYQESIFKRLEPNLQTQVAKMRHESNQRTLGYLTVLQEHQQALKKSELAEQESDVEQELLNNIATHITRYEPHLQNCLAPEAAPVSKAYEDYASLKSQVVGNEGSNIGTLFYLDDQNKKTQLTNLVVAAQLDRKIETFLNECEVHNESPIGGALSYEDIYSGIEDNTYFDDEVDVVGGERKKAPSILGKLVPYNLENQFREEKVKKDADYVILTKGE